MPIYEYECEKCGRVHEILQKMSDKPLSTCPECKGHLNKRISQCTFHLKGTGWYATDYASGSSNHSASVKKKNDASADGSSSDAKKNTDTKNSD